MLPAGYTQIEYVESNGTGSYFNTGILPSADLKVVFDGYVVSGDTALYGSRYNSRDNRYTVQFVGSEQYRLGYDTTEKLADVSYTKGIRHVFTQIGGKFYIDDVLAAEITANPTYPNAQEIYAVGALNTKGSATNLGVVRMYSMQMYRGEELLRDFVAVRAADASVGIFDLVSQAFFANAGSGTVAGGEALPPELAGISITTMPTKTEYKEGEELDLTGMVVTAAYSDGTSVVVTDYTVSGFDSSTSGEKTITVTYLEFTAFFTVAVEVTIVTEDIGTPTLTDVTARLNVDTGVVTISGTGAIRTGNVLADYKSQIKEVVIKTGITVVGRDNFNQYTALEKVTIEEGVTALSLASFYYCTGLKTASLPESLQSVGESCFAHCKKMYISPYPFLPAIQSIGPWAFQETRVSKIYLGASLESIGIQALEASSLSIVYIQKDKDTISGSPWGCSGEIVWLGADGGLDEENGVFYQVDKEAGESAAVLFRDTTGLIKDVTVKAEYGGCPVRKVGSYAFSSAQLENVTLPEGLREIGESTFRYSTGTVNIPESVEIIGTGAFIESGLTSATIPSGVTSVGEYCFSRAQFLEHVEYNTDADIPGFMCYGCAKLTEIEITGFPSSVGEYAFYDCRVLSGITLPESVRSIGGGTFGGCAALQALTLPERLETLGDYCFSGCGITELTIPRYARIESTTTVINGLQNLERLVYADGNKTVTVGGVNCPNLKYVHIPACLEVVKTSAFPGGAVNLSCIDFGPGVKELEGGAILGQYGLTEITLPPGMERIGDDSFFGCKNITKYTVYDWDMVIPDVENALFPSTAVIYGWRGSTAEDYAQNHSRTFIPLDEEIVPVYLDIVTPPAKLAYTTLDSGIDTAGMVVRLLYTDGREELVTDYVLFGYGSAPGEYKITATHSGLSDSFYITVSQAYRVQFLDRDGSLLKEETVLEGASATPPEPPAVTGYDFIGWDASYEDVRADTVCRALYEAQVFSVTWLGWDGTELKTETVAYGNDAAPPEIPARNGYAFAGWDKGYTCVTADITITAQYVPQAVDIRIAHYPDKVYYKIGDAALDTTGLEVAAVMADGTERAVAGYTVSGFDSSAAGIVDITVHYEEELGDDVTAVFFTGFSVKVTATGGNPFEGDSRDVQVTVHWPGGEFEDLGNADLSGPITLKESICNERYFIWGGCISNQLSFSTHSSQFMGTDEDAYPHGDIEVYVECQGTKVKVFTGTINSGKRTSGLTQRDIEAYDYLYKFRNTDIAWWYKNKTTDKQMLLTQKQFRDALFAYLGIEQVPTKLEYDDAMVPNTNDGGEMNVTSILRDLCLQNSVFGWVNRDGKFEYLRVQANCRVRAMDNDGNLKYEYYPAAAYFDLYEECEFTEGRIWYPKEFIASPYPGVFSPGEGTAQEAYEDNVYYNRNSFFVGDSDWLDSAFQADEYGVYTRTVPIMPICYGTTTKWDNQHIYRAQGYKLSLKGNPLNKVGDSIEITVRKTADDGTELCWTVHSYILSRTLKILGDGSLTDTYSAENGPYNGNSSQAGKYTQELSAELFRHRSEMPTISYAPFGSGVSTLEVDGEVKKDRLRCVKTLSEAEYEALAAAGSLRTDTLYFIKEE